MGRGPSRLLPVVLVLGLMVAACGGDEGEVFPTTTAGSASTVGETTTTTAWGDEVAPGVEALVEGAQVLLREDFQDGDTAGWLVETGWYILTNGERRMAAAGGEAWAWYEEGLGWSRYGVRLGLMVEQGSLGVSVAVGEGGRYVVQFSEQGVHLLKDAPYGSIQALGSAQPVSLGEPHVLAVGVDGGHVQVYVDGVLLIDATDPSPLSGGSIGLGAGADSSVAVDNIVVVSLAGPLPELQAVAEPADEPLPDALADAAPQAGESLEDAGGEPDDPTGLPNLVVTGVSLPADPAYEEPFDAEVTIRNIGDGDAGGFSVGFASQSVWYFAEVDGLASGAETVARCRVDEFEDEGEDSYRWIAVADEQRGIEESREDDNGAEGVITMGESAREDLPNVAISWVQHRPNPAEVGDVIAIDVDIEQTNAAWTGTLPDLEVRVFHEDDGRLACGATVASGETTATCDMPAFDDPGSYTVRIEIDVDDVLTESDEDDNIGRGHFISVLESSTGVPDLYLDSVSFDPPLPEPGIGFQFRIDVAGDPPTARDTLYTVRLSIDGVLACSWDAEGAPCGLVCYTDPYPAGIHEWTIEIDADGDVAETDEGNNTAYGQFEIEG